MNKVTELDFRLPEFRDANPNDYEFRRDGKIVRKDRWERAVHSIQQLVLPGAREFEIEEVVAAVAGWTIATNNAWEDLDLLDDIVGCMPEIDIRLENGSVLVGAERFIDNGNQRFMWNGIITDDVASWRYSL